jgi:hypothetical protein
MRGWSSSPDFLCFFQVFLRLYQAWYRATLGLNSLVPLPIVFFVHRHIDDYRRSFTGSAGWCHDARLLLPAAIDNTGWRELEQASPLDLTSAGCGNDKRYI